MGDVLISVPAAQLRRVQGEAQELVDTGAFTVSTVDEQGAGAECAIVARVGATRWRVLPSTATLQAGQLTFLFSLPEDAQQPQRPQQPQPFYSVTLAADTPPEAVGVVEAVLEGVSVHRQSPRLLGDRAAQAGEAELAAQAAAASSYQHRTARGISQASAGVASGILVR
jgi:hypothetical protein